MSKPWIATALLALACGSAGELITPEPGTASKRLLFVGNSLTYTHNIPQLVQQLAMAAGKPEPVVVMRAGPNLGLEDHWRTGTVQRDLREGRYDVMILQQGPSTLAASGQDLLQWVVTLAQEATTHKTRTGVYAVAPPADGNFDGGITNYRRAADSAKAAFYPVSQAWQEAQRLDPSLPLYGPDGFHPSPHGALLAAMVITGVIFDVDPTKMTEITSPLMSEAQLSVMRRAASTAVKSAGRK
jgi:hypothetical protein